MKKYIFTACILVLSLHHTNAQLGGALNKAKGATKDKVDQKAKEVKNDPTKIKDAASGEPAYDPESPAYKAFSTAKMSLGIAENALKDENWKRNPEGGNRDVEVNLKKVKESFTVLDNDPIESKKPYLKDMKQRYDTIEASRIEKFDQFNTDLQFEMYLRSFSSFASNGSEIKGEEYEASYKGYKKFRKAFEEKSPEVFKKDHHQRTIAGIDKYFSEDVYKAIPKYNERLTEITKDMYADRKNDGGSFISYHFNAPQYLKNIEQLEQDVIYDKTYLIENTTDIDPVLSKLTKEKDVLKEYIDSGKYDEFVKKNRQAIVDAVRFSPKKMTNDSYEKLAAAAMRDEGQVLRTVVTSNEWFVKKNEYGIPSYKYVPVQVAVKRKDGTCHLRYSIIIKTYEGGGVYSSSVNAINEGYIGEMNCANVNK